jgi:uncharacterized protein CbrC (UPF0167 family)
MLHTPMLRPLYWDAVAYCLTYCEEVCIVCRPDGDVERSYSRLFKHPRVRIVHQERPTGVVNGISTVGRECILVAFGDCYGYEWIPCPHPNTATVLPSRVNGLDGWSKGHWVGRCDEAITHSFIGAARFSDFAPEHKELVPLFNAHKLTPFVVSGGICDCGTPEGYSKIWSSS